MSLNNDQKVANNNFEQLLQSIQSKDKALLSSLFSSSGKNNCFSQSADELCNYFVGDVLSYNDWGGPYVQTDYEQGNVKEVMESTYDVKTTECDYRFAIRYIVRNNIYSESVGIESLYVIKREDDTLLKYAYWGDGKFTPGINIGIPNTE